MIAAAYTAVLLVEAPTGAALAARTDTPWWIAAPAIIAASYATLAVLIVRALRHAEPDDRPCCPVVQLDDRRPHRGSSAARPPSSGPTLAAHPHGVPAPPTTTRSSLLVHRDGRLSGGAGRHPHP